MKKLGLVGTILLMVGMIAAQSPSKPTMDEATDALKSMLKSSGVQNHFPGNNTIFILTTNQLCFQIYCQSFELKPGGQKVFIGSMEELFMRGVKKWMEIDGIGYSQNNQVIISYHIN